MPEKRPDESTTEFTVRCILDEEAEACARIAETIYAKNAFHFELGTAVADAIRARIVARAEAKEGS